MPYLLMVSHGPGYRYLWHKEIESLEEARKLAIQQVRYINDNRPSRTRLAKIAVLQKVEEYDNESGQAKKV